MPSSYDCFQTGVMMASVRNNEIEVITWLGGSCWVPSAWRSKLITTMMRMKLVVISNTAGAMLSTVRVSMICSDEVSPSGLVHTVGPPESMLGSSTRVGVLGGSWAKAVVVGLARQTLKVRSIERRMRVFMYSAPHRWGFRVRPVERFGGTKPSRSAGGLAGKGRRGDRPPRAR